MPAIAEQVADRFIGHDVDLLRLAESERETIFRMLGQLQTSLLDKMQGQIPLPGFETYSQRQTQALFTLTDKLIAQKYGQISREHQSTLVDLAEFESERTRRLVNAQVGVALLSVGVPFSTLKALANDDLVEGRPAKEWWSQQSDNLRGRFQQTIRQGVFAGETLGQLQQRVRGTKARNFQDGIMAITSRNAEALIRTSVQSVANAARHATFTANDDVLAGFQALVTLDTRTSELCMARSGFAWDLDGNPLNEDTKIPFPGPPPWHFNCRTTLVPVLKSWEQLEKDAKGDEDLGKKLDRVEDKLDKGTQASMDGQVAADLTYDEWLKGRSEEAQIEALGRGRWQLWRRNLIALNELVDQRGHPVTLDELKARAGVESLANLNTWKASSGTPDEDTIIPEARPEDNPLPAQRELASLAVASLKRNPKSGANGSKIVTFVDASKGVFKPLALEEADLRPGIENYYTREALATDIAAIVRYNDLVPTTAVTTLRKEPGSIQAFVTGARAAFELDGTEMFGSSQRDVRRAILFDAILGNTDRHARNWMVSDEGKLVLIDHGLMLSTQNQYLKIGLLRGLDAAQRKRAIPENMKLPWRSAWPKMQAAFEARGIEPAAIRLAKQRLDRILKPGTTWASVEELA
jgi:SPP1 gp7 family putative phage head morphogenesis protein